MMKLKLTQFHFDVRSRFLVAVMIVVSAGAAYYRFIYTPRAMVLTSAMEHYTALKGEIGRLESSMPDIKAAQAKLKALKDEYTGLKNDVTRSEKVLPKNVNIPDILAFLTRYETKFGVKIINIKFRKDTAKDVPLYVPEPGSKQKPVSYYFIMPIDIALFGQFDNIIKYVGNIERKLPYQWVGALQIDMQKTSGGEPQCFLTVFSILGRGEEEDENMANFRQALKKAEVLGETKDPFHKKERPREEERLSGAELKGIMKKSGTFYAIINGSLYKVGDTIQNKKIISIESNKVLMEEEDKLFYLSTKGEK